VCPSRQRHVSSIAPHHHITPHTCMHVQCCASNHHSPWIGCAQALSRTHACESCPALIHPSIHPVPCWPSCSTSSPPASSLALHHPHTPVTCEAIPSTHAPNTSCVILRTHPALGPVSACLALHDSTVSGACIHAMHAHNPTLAHPCSPIPHLTPSIHPSHLVTRLRHSPHHHRLAPSQHTHCVLLHPPSPLHPHHAS